MTAAVVADRVSKRYRLGVNRRGYKTVRESIANAAARPVRRIRGHEPVEVERDVHLWALRDMSFEIEVGDVVGIIGRNGAGKTTILKILSSITPPTSGWAEIRGRVGSLLEVGTGFHPELTGRENVFLSGAVLGMRRSEIRSRFDEIVEFAEVEEFLDTPIKRYSSGMKVRLAFAVAAHLEPEVLIVDEVLAVGDLAFQRKCLGKMGDVTREGRTVLFVSHNMSVVQGFCRRAILLDAGHVVVDGSVDDAITTYLRRLADTAAVSLADRTDRRGWQEIRLERVEVTSGEAGEGTLVTGSAALFGFHLTGALSRMACSFTIYNYLGHPVATLDSAVGSADDRDDRTDGRRFECRVDELPLVPGRYRIDVTIRGGGHTQDALEAAAYFDVEQGLLRGRPVTGGEAHGNVALPHRWVVPATAAAADRGPR